MKATKQRKLFGTDGIRSRFGTYPLDESSIITLGKAIGNVIKDSKILIGRDTRHSGNKIEELLNTGLSGSCDIKTCGIVPTPVLSFLVGSGNFDFGIMITASHNPYFDNGVKFFKNDGEKISETLQILIEKEFFNLDKTKENFSKKNIDQFKFDDIYANYLQEVVRSKRLMLNRKDKKPFKIVIDCANGAFYKEAEKVFTKLDIDFILINNKPDGKNINEDCGALHTDLLTKSVIENNAELGIAFDGDGDRLICVDKNGFVLNGDHIILLIARYFESTENERTVIGTTMANLGFEKALNKLGIKLIRTDVGDKYVYKEMKKTGAILGGEQSGHIIIKGYKTGDALLSALYFLTAINYLGDNIDEIYKQIDIYPQIIKSYNVSKKIPLDNWSEMQKEITRFNNENGENSRLVIRYSGTEPKIRVMIESESEKIIEKNIYIFEDIISKGVGNRE